MYICISSDKPSIIQMEIIDFCKKSRKIVFNLDKKRDYNKAKKTFTPKGLKKRRKRKSKKNQKQIQRTIADIVDSYLKIDIPNNKINEKLETRKKREVSKYKIILEDSVIQEFGTGGNLEVICPFCQDTINFEYYNLEEKKKKATRICSCDAIARISTRAFNKKIFSDLGIQNKFFNEFVQKIENELQDEFGNPIFTYAFRNDQNLLND